MHASTYRTMNKEIEYKPASIVAGYLEGPGMPLIMEKGDPMSTKATNNEIVRSLIVLTQDFYDNLPPENVTTLPQADQEAFQLTIDENNLVLRISQALSRYRRQRDRLADLLGSMENIVSGV